MTQTSVPAMSGPQLARDNPWTRSAVGLAGMVFLTVMVAACLLTLPWSLGVFQGAGETAPYKQGSPDGGRVPPSWWAPTPDQILRLNSQVPQDAVDRIAAQFGTKPIEARQATHGELLDAMRPHWRRHLLGTDVLGRSILVRAATGGGISLTIGIAAALLSVFIGTAYGAIAAFTGGKVDAIMMRIVDILYGLPYILLVVLLAVASDAAMDEYIARTRARKAAAERLVEIVAVSRGQPATQAKRLKQTEPGLLESAQAAIAKLVAVSEPDPSLPVRDRAMARAAAAEAARKDFEATVEAGLVPSSGERSPGVKALLASLTGSQPKLLSRQVSDDTRMAFDVVVLLVAIGGVSWLTMARVIRGQVLSLKAQAFMEAARAMGVPVWRQLLRHVFPNLLGPVIVYATLTVPQAILQESFLSFLGIGVKPPLPSWGNMAAEGLSELNEYQSHWWILVVPCVLLGATLLALNFVGEGLREAFDPKRARR